MEIIWHKDQLIEALGEELLSLGDDISNELSNLVIDSRKIQPSEIFVAFPGEKVNGHDFAGDAILKGAGCCLVDDSSKLPDSVLPKSIIVKDCYKALLAMARYKRANSQAKFIGVTGSAGKTTTKEALNYCLSQFSRCHSTKGNYNNHLGLPLSLANLPDNTDYVVLEMGMNAPGEIKFLSELTRPHICIITTIHSAHFESFKNLEEIAREKLSITSGLEPNGLLIFDYNNKFLNLAASYANNFNFKLKAFDITPPKSGQENKYNLPSGNNLQKEGVSQYVAARVGKIVGGVTGLSSPQVADSFLVRIEGEEILLPKSQLGQLNMIVLLCASLLGISPNEILPQLMSCEKPEGRGKQHEIELEGKRLTIIDDSYNASPESMKKALLEFSAENSTGKKIAVLSDMGELGRISGLVHYQIAVLSKKLDIDMFILIGNKSKIIHKYLSSGKNTIHLSQGVTPKSLEEVVNKYAGSGDKLLFKGSNFTGLNNSVKYLLKSRS
jgi:UDP-N-acetylmuramoyl-tripeptide--D-alanyl-D-alanine ligase